MGRDGSVERSVGARLVAPVVTLLACYLSGLLLAGILPVVMALPPGEGMPQSYDAVVVVAALVVLYGGIALAGLTAIPWAWGTLVLVDGVVPRRPAGRERWGRRVVRAALLAVAGAAEIGIAVAVWTAMEWNSSAGALSPTEWPVLGVVVPRPVWDVVIFFAFVIAFGTMISLALAGLAVLCLFAPVALVPAFESSIMTPEDGSDAVAEGAEVRESPSPERSAPV